MIVHLASTSRIVEVVDDRGGAVPGRVWEGRTGGGIPVFAVVTRTAVRDDHDPGQFDAELQAIPDSTPSRESSAAIPNRLIL